MYSAASVSRLLKVSVLYLAGAAASGKTTTARVIHAITGAPYYEVEARECWSRPPGLARQSCFAEAFLRRMEQGPGVYTNHLLAVYGYTKAMGLDGLADEVEAVIRLRMDPVVLLTVSPTEMRRRIEKRMEEDREREANTVEQDIRLHTMAQGFMAALARKLGYPAIDTTHLTPAEVAWRVLDAYTRLF